jgi:hypothetical protein
MSATVPRDPGGGRYGRPVIKEPVWKPEIPFYFYFGGLAGASAGLAALSELQGNRELARRAWAAALAGGAVSPALLVADLGVPRRFLNMLRLFKVTSPMSVGSWTLAAFGPLTAAATASAWTGAAPRAGAAAKAGSALLGLPLSTYTAALVTNTAVPVWHESYRLLPFVYGSGAAQTAAAVAVASTPPEHAAPARRLAIAGALIEVGVKEVMHHQLGEQGEPYKKGAGALFGHVSRVCNLGGAALLQRRGARSRAAAVAGGVLLCAGALSARWSTFKAGFQSASDPKYVVGPQRRAIERGERMGLGHWQVEPVQVAPVLALAFAYLLRVRALADKGRPVASARQRTFYAGVLVIMLALVSPIDYLRRPGARGRHLRVVGPAHRGRDHVHRRKRGHAAGLRLAVHALHARTRVSPAPSRARSR